ncbi:YbaN family protein [Rossellomorea sp. y25]|uniref:YbaN family protein n=1 Tax=Rossellomorea sp. y25 TaxID=3118174 RepID=UPI00261AA19D|nr:YbaN family protein [uncultured Rossellomorea sp.]
MKGKEGVAVINKIKKMIYILLGLLFMGIGVVGIVLPLIPTTPLLLLASFFFVRGSERFEAWFKGTSVYKKHLEGFIRHRSMTLRQKVTLLIFSDIMILIPLILSDSLIVKVILSLIIVYKYYYFIFKIRTVAVRGD